MLIYPYWRNFEFCHHVLQETLSLLTSGGIHAVVKALLHIRTILDRSESYYVGNKIFVDPFLYCVQQTTEIPVSVIESLTHALLKEDAISTLKSALHLDLDRIEEQNSAQGFETENENDDAKEGGLTAPGDSESCCTDHDDNNNSEGSSRSSHIEGEEEGMKEESTGNRSKHAPAAFDEINPGVAPPNPVVLLDSIVGTGGNSMLTVINRHVIVDGGDELATPDGNKQQPIEVPPTPLPEGARRQPLIQEIA